MRPFDPIAQQQEVLVKFDEQILPFLKKHGQEIGELAMQGDHGATAIVQRYHVFCGWVDEENLKMLQGLLKIWKEKRES